jgi:hypothetical protein
MRADDERSIVFVVFARFFVLVFVLVVVIEVVVVEVFIIEVVVELFVVELFVDIVIVLVVVLDGLFLFLVSQAYINGRAPQGRSSKTVECHGRRASG